MMAAKKQNRRAAATHQRPEWRDEPGLARPEVPQFVEQFRTDYQEILAVRPGITDMASLRYRNEESLLAKAEDAENEYLRSVLPDKIRLAKDYIQRSSFLFDLRVILQTLFKLSRHTSELEQSRRAHSGRLHERY